MIRKEHEFFKALNVSIPYGEGNSIDVFWQNNGITDQMYGINPLWGR